MIIHSVVQVCDVSVRDIFIALLRTENGGSILKLDCVNHAGRQYSTASLLLYFFVHCNKSLMH